MHYILVFSIYSALCPQILVLQLTPLGLPALWIQQYVVIHQVGWWVLLYFLIIDLFFTSWPCPWKWRHCLWCELIFTLCKVSLLESLMDRKFVYSTTWYVSEVLAALIFVTSSQSSTVACSRLENVSWILTRFLIPLVYTPQWEVCWCSSRLAWALIKYTWNYDLVFLIPPWTFRCSSTIGILPSPQRRHTLSKRDPPSWWFCLLRSCSQRTCLASCRGSRVDTPGFRLPRGGHLWYQGQWPISRHNVHRCGGWGWWLV